MHGTGGLPAEVEVLVVGAGQAGLGAAHHLARVVDPAEVLVVDRAEVGQSWVDRWDSLRLFTPRRFSALPGRPFPAGPTRCPDRLEMADYLRAYARDLPVDVRTGVAVQALTGGPHDLRARTSLGEVRARHVVVAAGPFSRPYVPAAADDLAPPVVQLHSGRYRLPADVPTRDVLVVGGGNSAAQLSVELAATHEVTVVAPAEPWYLPVAPLGVDLYWWTALTGLLSADRDARASRYVRRRGDAVIGIELRRLVRAGRVALRTPRVVGADGTALVLADGSRAAAGTVLWCTGFRPDTSWVQVPGALDDDGAARHDRGASPVGGLHWMGLPWQARLDSSIVHGVDRDARELAARVRTQRGAGTASR